MSVTRKEFTVLNLLFYYDSESCNRPSGVVLLEGCYCERLITAGKNKEVADKQVLCSYMNIYMNMILVKRNAEFVQKYRVNNVRTEKSSTFVLTDCRKSILTLCIFDSVHPEGMHVKYNFCARSCVFACFPHRTNTRIRRPEFECSGPQLEGPEFECSGPQLEGPEFEYSELSLKGQAKKNLNEYHRTTVVKVTKPAMRRRTWGNYCVTRSFSKHERTDISATSETSSVEYLLFLNCVQLLRLSDAAQQLLSVMALGCKIPLLLPSSSAGSRLVDSRRIVVGSSSECRMSSIRRSHITCIPYVSMGTIFALNIFIAVSRSKQASQANRSSTRVCVRICVSIRRPEFECSGPQLEGPEFECSGPQLEGPEFEYSELSLKTIDRRSANQSSEY
ncbi:hypothetical protein ANN_12436 [Periplaneta americana]|uniref:Uncharacterized protein n=1 Tax=Periplaneta americana TaxID=6978 RepID=A0ABQ8TGH7_PERAM|nr:hypothetical protein ANN_12436 [Periplaneta americana]